MNCIKRIFVIVVFLTISSCIQCQKLDTALYRIIKIDSTYKHFLINALSNKNLDTVLIISTKIDTIFSFNCNSKITIYKTYTFVTEEFIKGMSIDKIPFSPNGFSIRLDNRQIWLNQKHLPLKTNNLVGLFYCPPK